MKKLFGLALILGLSLGISSPSFARDNNTQNNPPNGQERMGRKNGMGKMRNGNRRGGMMRELENLNLTDAQRQRLQNLRRNNQSGGANRAEMRQLMEAQRNGTLTAAQQLRLNILREQGRADAERMHQQILAILTPEQRLQLEQTRPGRKERMGGGMRAENANENRRANRGMRNGGMRGNSFEELNLTDAQKEQLRNLRTNNNSNGATRQEMRELRQAKQDGTLTVQQETRLKNLRRQTKADGESRQQQILSILTPEQRQQLEQSNRERKGQKRERRQNRMTQSSPQDN